MVYALYILILIYDFIYIYIVSYNKTFITLHILKISHHEELNINYIYIEKVITYLILYYLLTSSIIRFKSRIDMDRPEIL